MGGILGELLAIYRKNFLHFLGLVAAAAIPILVFVSLLIWYAFFFPLQGTGKLVIISFLLALLIVAYFLAIALVPAVVIHGVAGYYPGDTLKIGRAYQFEHNFHAHHPDWAYSSIL